MSGESETELHAAETLPPMAEKAPEMAAAAAERAMTDQELSKSRGLSHNDSPRAPHVFGDALAKFRRKER